MIKISFEYINFYHLWFISSTVHTILNKTDERNKNVYYYKLYIKRNDDLEWFKTVTFEKIELFRNYLLQYVKQMKDIPFPNRNILSYVPFIGKYYSDENNDVLIEKKYILDNFFLELCNIQQAYKLEEFNNFFTENNI